MNRTDYLAAINAKGIGTIGIEWTTCPATAAKHRHHTLRKVTTAMAMTGVEYAGLAVNGDRETGDLPWGEWAEFPYVITHKGNDYARIYTIDGTVRTTYLVDGDVVKRDVFNSYLTPSAARCPRPHGGVLTIKMENLRMIGDPALALV